MVIARWERKKDSGDVVVAAIRLSSSKGVGGGGDLVFLCLCVLCVRRFHAWHCFPILPLIVGRRTKCEQWLTISLPPRIPRSHTETNKSNFIENIRKNAGQPGRIRTGRGYIRVNKKMCVRVSCVHNFRLSFVTFSYDVYQRNDMPRELDTAGEFYISPVHLF
jgi:hypothetical protein